MADALIPEMPSAIDRNTRFGVEEWESWMHWDATAPPVNSTASAKPRYPPPLFGDSDSNVGITSSEVEPFPPFQPFYSIPPTTTAAANPKKRKNTALTDGGKSETTGTGSGRQPRGKKISHNIIEKRYRPIPIQTMACIRSPQQDTDRT